MVLCVGDHSDDFKVRIPRPIRVHLKVAEPDSLADRVFVVEVLASQRLVDHGDLPGRFDVTLRKKPSSKHFSPKSLKIALGAHINCRTPRLGVRLAGYNNSGPTF